ncbi:hypothetical protein XH96_27995 [Bradyrhizobium sp. CCBAU 51765]|nr:hypothetical protein XH96_27995 [Bradyrhizobium sp. CCBAU 51765]
MDYSPESDLALKLASDLHLDDELMNVILAWFGSRTFLHSQGQSRRFYAIKPASGLPLVADIKPPD